MPGLAISPTTQTFQGDFFPQKAETISSTPTKIDQLSRTILPYVEFDTSRISAAELSDSLCSGTITPPSSTSTRSSSLTSLNPQERQQYHTETKELMKWAIMNDSPGTLRKLLNDHHVSSRDKLPAICFALQNSKNPLPLLLVLTQRESLSEKIWGSWVRVAVIFNCPDQVEILLENGAISEEDRNLAMEKAIELKNPETVTILLQKASHTEEDRGHWIKCATEQRALEIIEILQKNGPIYTTDLDAAAERAKKLKYEEISRALEANQPCNCTLL